MRADIILDYSGFVMGADLTQVIHYESWHDAGKRADIEHFVAMPPGGDPDDSQNAHIYIGFTSRMLATAGMANAKDVSLLMRAALEHIRNRITANAITPGENYEFMFTSSEPPDLAEFKWKRCSYQQQDKAGLRCGAAHLRDKGQGVTTKALCQACELPSADLLCDELVHPVIVGNAEPNHLTVRSLVGAKCNIGSEEFDGRSPLGAARCVPQGYGCWHKILRQSPETAVKPTAEAATLIDHINIVFRKKFGQPLLQIRKAQTITTISDPGPVDDREAFESRVQALGRLIEHMAGHDLAKEAGATPANPGAINGLEAFLAAKSIPGAAIIQPLRDLITVRVDLSHDVTDQDVVAAFGRLGIPMPVRDYEYAWNRITTAFLSALEHLEAAVR